MAASATAHWEGTLDDGSGTMSTATGLQGSFTKASRFSDGAGTNPEELLGAAHAGCFSQFLALLLSEHGAAPISIDTTAKVPIAVGDDGPTINLWNHVLLYAPDYDVDPIERHRHLHEQDPFNPELFDRWLQIFYDTVDGGWEGPNASRAKKRATGMAWAMAQRFLGHGVWRPASHR